MQLRKQHAGAAAVTMVIIALTTYAYWAKHHINTDNAYLKANMILVSSKVTGFIEKIHVKDNQWVKKGTPLITIESKDHQDRVRQAEADVEAQAAKAQNLIQQIALQGAELDEVDALLSAREASLKEAQNNLKRVKSLRRKGATSENTLDNATSKYKNALSGLQQARAKRRAVKDKLEVIHADQAAAAAQMKKAKATLALSKRMLKDTVIAAPFDGVFTNRGVYVGQLVHPALNLAHLVAQDVWLEANYKENQMENIRIGQHANIKVDAYPHVKFTGTVESISPASGADFSLLPPENATGNFTKVVRRIPVKIKIDAPQKELAQLKSGLSANVTILVP